MGINLLIPGTFAKWLGEGFLNIKPQRNTREGVKTYDVRSRNPSTASFWEGASGLPAFNIPWPQCLGGGYLSHRGV